MTEAGQPEAFPSYFASNPYLPDRAGCLLSQGQEFMLLPSAYYLPVKEL